MPNAIGAVSGEAAEWYAIDWQTINQNVRRLQVRIAQATKENRWGEARALQRLLTHSYSGRVLAVRRVTENIGKKTPSVDKEIWATPERKTQAVHALKRRGYQPQPLRRSIVSVGPVSPHRRPVAFAGTGPPRSGMCPSATGDGRKDARPRPDR
jgi:RNA-directed DNA polymerase